MINFYKKNKKAFLFAVTLHGILILFLFKSFYSHHVTEEPASEKIIEASLLSPIENVVKLQAQAEQESHDLEVQEQVRIAEEKPLMTQAIPEQQKKEDERIKQQELMADQEEQKNEDKRIKKQKLVAVQEKQKKDLLEAQNKAKTLQALHKKEIAQKQKALVAQEKQKKAKAKEVALQKKIWAEKQKKEKLHALIAQDFEREIVEEEKHLASAHAANINQQELDRYKTKIIHAISQHWIIPETANKNLNCKLLIRLATEGKVVDVTLVSSSGDIALDRSAMAAVYKASPLPLPIDPTVADQFREFQLTVHPEVS